MYFFNGFSVKKNFFVSRGDHALSAEGGRMEKVPDKKLESEFEKLAFVMYLSL